MKASWHELKAVLGYKGSLRYLEIKTLLKFIIVLSTHSAEHTRGIYGLKIFAVLEPADLRQALEKLQRHICYREIDI